MNTLYLTWPEQILFQALPSGLTEGWKLATESLGFVDTPERRELRLSLVRVHDQRLKDLRDKVQKAQTVEEVATHIQDMDLKGIDDDDIASLFFGLGPAYISNIVQYMLRTAKADRELEGITALTVIRHSLLNSFLAASRK